MQVQRNPVRPGRPFRKAVVLAVCCSMAAFMAPVPAQSAWDDRSGDLPGFTSKQGVLIAGGAAAAVTAVVWFAHKKRNSKRAAVSPAKLVFEEAQVGARKEQTLTIVNRSQEPLAVEEISIRGESFALAEQPALPRSLAPGQQLEVRVTFAPASKGSAKGRLQVLSSGPGLKAAKSSSARLVGRGRHQQISSNGGSR